MDAQGSQAHAKEDTVFLGLTTVATDLSQVGTNLTAAAGGGYELASVRAAINTNREVYVRCVIAGTDTNRAIAVHSNTTLTSLTWGVGVNGSAQIILFHGSALVWTAPTACNGSDYSIAWSTRLNPDTTGAGDVKISEVLIYNHTSGVIEALEQFTHAYGTTNNSWNLGVGGYWNGATLTGGTATGPTKFRLSTTFHPHTEALQEWVSARATHSTTFAQVTEPLGCVIAGNAGQWAGQGNVGFAAAHARELRPRLLSPMINEVYRTPDTFASTPSPTNMFKPVPTAPMYDLDLTTVRWVPVPDVSCALVRVHVKSWVTSGSAVPVGVRCYIVNDNGTLAEFVSAKISIDHGAGGVGQWVELGCLKLPNKPTVRLVLAYSVDPSSTSANDAAARYQIRAWQVRPIFGEVP